MSKQKSTTTSELLKTNTNTNKKDDKKINKKNLTNLNDIESVLNELEIKHDTLANNEVKRICNCMARRHPLFEIAPNCLNCGKIICTKEGLQPCSFCGNDIIPSKEKDAIIKLLEKERTELLNANNKQESTTPTNKPRKKIVVKMNPGEKFWEAQDRAFKLAEQEMKNEEIAKKEQLEQQELQAIDTKNNYKLANTDQDLVKAQEKLETLLNFQETGEERTRIIDNAADFELPTQSIWLSPEERALNLKKQQRMSKDNKAESERHKKGEKQVEMVIKDGKVTMVEKYKPIKEQVSNEEIKLMQDVKTSKKQQFTNNESTWDYDEDKKKWGKPVYFSENNGRDENQELENKAIKSRIQFDVNKDTSELIATII
ncbi:hypothetical protein KGF54_004186 [Candida jiufengensis]|uniref:uncharacterized protein n=1 Tax=Candida jiufengensis TaxID=497108 RepID=UPI00222536CC|nr:uncharacterized protein KGF54_004186 [Candida jiufengensis]KAI5951112.1 hypothetical protein KGF54_004186 [Candida jiufengensis]